MGMLAIQPDLIEDGRVYLTWLMAAAYVSIGIALIACGLIFFDIFVRGRRPDRNQSGYSSFRKVLALSGWAFGVRSSKKLKYGATNGSGADTV